MKSKNQKTKTLASDSLEKINKKIERLIKERNELFDKLDELANLGIDGK